MPLFLAWSGNRIRMVAPDHPHVKLLASNTAIRQWQTECPHTAGHVCDPSVLSSWLLFNNFSSTSRYWLFPRELSSISTFSIECELDVDVSVKYMFMLYQETMSSEKEKQWMAIYIFYIFTIAVCKDFGDIHE